jgi:hypothetical protein
MSNMLQKKPIQSIVLFCLLSRFCCLADDTNIIAVSDWSEPVGFHTHSVRGRLLILNGSEPADGGSKTDQTMMFVELQQVTGAQAPSVKIYFDVMNLSCNLTDSNGKPSLKPNSFPGEDAPHSVRVGSCCLTIPPPGFL